MRRWEENSMRRFSSFLPALRHLALSVHLAAIDRKPEGTYEENAHSHYNENDDLSVLAAETFGTVK
jgi:hypothetical protein